MATEVKELNERIGIMIAAHKSNAHKVAMELGCDPKSVYRYMRDETIPSSSAIIVLLKLFSNVSPRWLLLGDGDVYLNKEGDQTQGNAPASDSGPSVGQSVQTEDKIAQESKKDELIKHLLDENKRLHELNTKLINEYVVGK